MRFGVRFHLCHPHIVHTSSAPCADDIQMSSAHCPYHVWMTSKCHPHVVCTCLSCPISCSTTPGVMHMSSTGMHAICTLSAGMYIIRRCHPHLPEVPNFIHISGTTSGTTVTSKTTSFGTRNTIGIHRDHGDSWE